jgi:hypothetical protein
MLYPLLLLYLADSLALLPYTPLQREIGEALKPHLDTGTN